MNDLELIKVVPATDMIAPRPNWMMSDVERATVVAMLRHIRAETVIEVGIHEGIGAEIYLLNVPSIKRYVGVDVLPGYITSKSVQQVEIPEVPGRYVKNDPRFELILKPRGSLDLPTMDDSLPLDCDAFIIDGDHGREAILHDVLLATVFVRRGGLIIWHDYFVGDGPLDVRAVLNERSARGSLVFHIEGTWLAVEFNTGAG